LVQRVAKASVTVDRRVVAAIDHGLLVLAAFLADDDDQAISWMAKELVNLRLFADAEGKMNRSLADIGGEALIVSQFTLYGDARKGRRPSFVRAARPEAAIPLYEGLAAEMKTLLPGRVRCGRFGAEMQVALVNDGPVTLVIDR